MHTLPIAARLLLCCCRAVSCGLVADQWIKRSCLLTGVIILAACLGASAALKLTPAAAHVGRREAVRAAALLPLFASAAAVNADDASLAAAATPEGEAAFMEIFAKALEKKKATYKEMGIEVEESDAKELEKNLRTKYCGFPAEIKCLPASYMKKAKK